MNPQTRRERILGVIEDMVIDFLDYDRREDEELPRGEIEAAVGAGEIAPPEMVGAFASRLSALLGR